VVADPVKEPLRAGFGAVLGRSFRRDPDVQQRGAVGLDAVIGGDQGREFAEVPGVDSGLLGDWGWVAEDFGAGPESGGGSRSAPDVTCWCSPAVLCGPR